MAKDGLGKKRNRAVRTHTGATRVGVVKKKERIDGDGPQGAMDRIAICCFVRCRRGRFGRKTRLRLSTMAG